MATTTNAVSAHYIIFYYSDALGANNNYRFVVLPSATTAPTTYAAIGAYDGHITLRAKKTERAGLIFLPGSTSLDSDGVPNDTLAASTTFKLYAASAAGEKVGDAVKELTVKTGARGPESPFRVRRNSNLLTRIYVGKTYGIVPFSDYTTSTDPSRTVLYRGHQEAASFHIFYTNTVDPRFNPVVNTHDMSGNNAHGVLLFRDSDHTSLNNNAKNLGENNSIGVVSDNGTGSARIRLHFSDDAEGERSITNESGFATSPAVD